MKVKLLPFVVALGLSITSVQAYAWEGDISHNDNRAYVQDRDGYMVRDSWGKCVRTIHWSKESAIAKCEGLDEPVVATKPAPVVKAVAIAKPAPVVKAAPVTKPAPVVKEKPAKVMTPIAFTGLFEVGSNNLTVKAKTKLDEYVDFLNSNPNKVLNIQGHTDSSGSTVFNQNLSERRANAVKSYLESKGIDSNRLTAVGAGELLPAASNATAEGRAHNRRVVIQVLD